MTRVLAGITVPELKRGLSMARMASGPSTVPDREPVQEGRARQRLQIVGFVAGEQVDIGAGVCACQLPAALVSPAVGQRDRARS